MWQAENLALVALTFLVAGFVKGIVGLGLPTIVLGVLTTTYGITPAIAMMLVPSLVTNAIQDLPGIGHLEIALDSGATTIEHGSFVSEADIHHAIEDAGFGVR